MNMLIVLACLSDASQDQGLCCNHDNNVGVLVGKSNEISDTLLPPPSQLTFSGQELKFKH